MNYIGSKFSLLNFLGESIQQVAGKNPDTFCDLFAGTGAVGIHFKQQGYKIIANDIQYYSYILNRHYIGNHTPLQFSKIDKAIPGLSKMPLADRADFVCAYLAELPGVKGFIYNNYCLGGANNKTYKRQYFSDANGMRCDAIRVHIQQWKDKGYINDDEYFFLLASLIEAIDKYANTASVYGAFLKRLKLSAQRPMSLKPAQLILGKQSHQVYNQEINQLVPKIKGDILYLDPPYNHRQYATNYHLLETIARYDSPKIYGKTGLRPYDQQKSDFAQKSKVKTAFKELILNANAKYIFLSYNNEGLMSLDDIKQIMSLRGQYGHFTKTHNRFKADRAENRAYKASKTTEYLHYVVVEK